MTINKYKCPTPVAILMAVYNGANYLKEQIESILHQDCNDWTLYIRDDNSTDSSKEIINYYTTICPNKIILIDQEERNLGCNQSFYCLLRIVEANYYCYCDQDDVWYENKVQCSLKDIKEKELLFPNSPILVHYDTEMCDEKLNVIYPSQWQRDNQKPQLFNSYSMLLVSPNVAGSMCIFNNISKQYIFPTPKEAHIYYDHWTSLAIALNGKVFAKNIVLKKYRMHSGQECGLDKPLSKYSLLSKIKNIVKHTSKDAKIFKSIGVSKYQFYYFKVQYIIRRIISSRK